MLATGSIENEAHNAKQDNAPPSGLDEFSEEILPQAQGTRTADLRHDARADAMHEQSPDATTTTSAQPASTSTEPYVSDEVLPVGPFSFSSSRLEAMALSARSDHNADYQPPNRSQAARKALVNAGKASTSQYRGVNKHSRSNRWEAHIWDGRQLHLGCFDNELQAAAAYDVVAIKMRGPGAPLNFPLHHYQTEMMALQQIPLEQLVTSVRASRRNQIISSRLQAHRRTSSASAAPTALTSAAFEAANDPRPRPLRLARPLSTAPLPPQPTPAPTHPPNLSPTSQPQPLHLQQLWEHHLLYQQLKPEPQEQAPPSHPPVDPVDSHPQSDQRQSPLPHPLSPAPPQLFAAADRPPKRRRPSLLGSPPTPPDPSTSPPDPHSDPHAHRSLHACQSLPPYGTPPSDAHATPSFQLPARTNTHPPNPPSTIPSSRSYYSDPIHPDPPGTTQPLPSHQQPAPLPHPPSNPSPFATASLPPTRIRTPHDAQALALLSSPSATPTSTPSATPTPDLDPEQSIVAFLSLQLPPPPPTRLTPRPSIHTPTPTPVQTPLVSSPTFPLPNHSPSPPGNISFPSSWTREPPPVRTHPPSDVPSAQDILDHLLTAKLPQRDTFTPPPSSRRTESNIPMELDPSNPMLNWPMHQSFPPLHSTRASPPPAAAPTMLNWPMHQSFPPLHSSRRATPHRSLTSTPLDSPTLPQPTPFQPPSSTSSASSGAATTNSLNSRPGLMPFSQPISFLAPQPTNPLNSPLPPPSNPHIASPPAPRNAPIASPATPSFTSPQQTPWDPTATARQLLAAGLDPAEAAEHLAELAEVWDLAQAAPEVAAAEARALRMVRLAAAHVLRTRHTQQAQAPASHMWDAQLPQQQQQLHHHRHHHHHHPAPQQQRQQAGGLWDMPVQDLLLLQGPDPQWPPGGHGVQQQQQHAAHGAMTGGGAAFSAPAPEYPRLAPRAAPQPGAGMPHGATVWRADVDAAGWRLLQQQQPQDLLQQPQHMEVDSLQLFYEQTRQIRYQQQRRQQQQQQQQQHASVDSNPALQQLHDVWSTRKE